jgi:hypothetical protein
MTIHIYLYIVKRNPNVHKPADADIERPVSPFFDVALLILGALLAGIINGLSL